jgi:hypothetical protein
MNVLEIASLALTSLIILVVIHLSVFWVVKTMFPAPVAVPAPPPPVPAPVLQQVYVEPPEMKQELNVPTYEPPVPVATPRTEVPGTTDIAALQNSPPV